ncbi:sensor histidine kinase [Gordoniibacillus kamchatkensis]|uniref:sensor histidine kinase n=1 Tax=Gordoniibacillus kamchatkensis TaxID=1590651 RepID=UPI000695B7A2|nr:sensor histidine kinase [Paenibacillus sp. VKM B-2647]
MDETQLNRLATIGISPALYGGLTVVLLAIQNLSSWLMGALLYRYGRRDNYCVLASLLLVVTGTAFSTDDMVFALHPFVEPLFRILDGFGTMYVFFLFLLPEGRFRPRWTLVPALSWVILQAGSMWLPFLPVLSMRSWPFWLRNAYMLFAHASVIAAYWQLCRKGTMEQRRQTAWFTGGMLCYIIAGVSGTFQITMENGIVKMALQSILYVGLLFIPFSVGVMVLENRLRNIAVSYNRTLVYVVLSGVGILAYALLVGVFGLLFQGRTNGVVGLLVAGLAAVLFHPLRERVQISVNRLVYGERDDPYQVLAGLSQRLEGALTQRSLLPAVVETTAHALRLPYAAIAMQTSDGTERIAAFGKPQAACSSIPLTVQGEQVGKLVLGIDNVQEALPPGKRHMLHDLVRHISIAVQAERLTEELRRSRERLVSAREEERRRLRRDLHDGLGSGLASMMLRLDEALQLHEREPERSRRALETVQAQMRESIADIRRLVYALRPPALDEFGLAFALQELVMQYEDPALSVRLEGADRGFTLPAAVEVAVYRIVQEALTNTVRHSGATSSSIVLRVEDGATLALDIRDNGRGLPQKLKPGIGLRSMKERAEELGGSYRMHSEPGQGTAIFVRLPMEEGGWSYARDGRGKAADFAG